MASAARTARPLTQAAGLGGLGWRRRGGRRGEARDRLQNAFAVAKRQPKLFQVAVCEIGKHVRVDLVVPESVFVLAESETAKPTADIHGRASQGLVE